jgi:hypothetical protein
MTFETVGTDTPVRSAMKAIVVVRRSRPAWAVLVMATV